MKRRAIAVAIAVLLLGAGPAFAIYSKTTSVGSNSLSTGTLLAPTGISATNAGASGIRLDWSASASSFEDGYLVLRSSSSGGPYTQIGATSASVTDYDDPVAAGTYYYVVRTTGLGWTSANSTQVSAASTIANTGYLACSANAAVTTGAGDNNGFQTNPAAGCTNTSTLATDTNTGTGTTDTCTGTTKDRHQYYNFGISIPAGKTIDGIEIRAALRENNTTGT